MPVFSRTTRDTGGRVHFADESGSVLRSGGLRRNVSNVSLASMQSYDSTSEQPGADQSGGMTSGYGSGGGTLGASEFDANQAAALCEWLQWEQLYNRFRVVVEVKPMMGTGSPPCVRISAQIYNERAEYELLACAVLQIRAELCAMQTASKAAALAAQAVREGKGGDISGERANTNVAPAPSSVSKVVAAAVAETVTAAEKVAKSAAAVMVSASAPATSAQPNAAAS